MAKRIPVFIIFLLHALLAEAQYSFLNTPYSAFSFSEFYPARRNIALYSEYYSGSTAITNKFFNYYYLGKFIDTELKNEVTQRLDPTGNRLGTGANASLIYTYKIKEKGKVKDVFFAGIGTRHFAEANFSDDLFELYFRGNKGFEGATANFNDFRFRLFEYQKLTWGKLIMSNADSSKMSFGYSVSFLLGQRFNDIDVNGSIYTAPRGEYLDVKASGNLHATDSSHTSPASLNGYGGSLDFYFHYPLSNSFDMHVLLSDLGFINWNNKTSVITVDTVYHFEGVAVDNLFDFSDTVFRASSLTDSAQANGFLTHHVKQNYSTILPAKASFQLSYKYNEIISFSLTDEIMTGKFFRNFITLEMGCKPWDKIILSAQVSYGGYGNFDAGAVMSLLVVKDFTLTIGSHSVTGLLFPSYFTSQSAFVSLKKYFN